MLVYQVDNEVRKQNTQSQQNNTTIIRIFLKIMIGETQQGCPCYLYSSF